MSDRLFPESQPLIVFRDGKVSKRTQLARQAMLRRLGSMHGKHGHGDGRACQGCVHLIRKFSPSRKCFLKCELYNRYGYEGTDWRASWPACGAFTTGSMTRTSAGSRLL